MTKPTTLIEVAQLAGLSTATVARVLKNRGYVSSEARSRIEAALKSTGYRPNAMARGLRQQRSFTIGHVVTAVTANPFFVNVAHGAEDEAFANGFKTLLFNHNGSAERERAGIERFIEQRVDAVLFTTAISADDVTMLINDKIPVVQIERRATLDAPSVTVDNEIGALEAMEYLARLGHRRIAFIGGIADLRDHLVETERESAYRRGLANAGLSWTESLVRFGEYYSQADGSGGDGYRHTKAFLTGPRSKWPTAIFATCDILAAGALQAIYEAGLRVPDDISLIGFDDTLANNLTPRLTTVAQPMEELGRRAFGMALQMIEGDWKPDAVRLPSRLVIRESVAPPSR
ncbi:MAG: LacI family DNA-binding transcriptional regulator [Devosia sp.]